MITLEKKIGQLVMIGFQGKTLKDLEISGILNQVERGLIGGVIEFAYNIETASQIRTLNHQLQAHAPSDHPLFIAVDQEGGKVQRLNSKTGHKDFLSAAEVSQHFTYEEAQLYYEALAQEVAKAGFNLNFAPVVDLAGGCPVVEGLSRSYHQDPSEVIQYAKAFIQAHRRYHVLTSLKHFPGHGFAKGDTHKGLVDITQTFLEEELSPFYDLMKEEYADTVMVGHVTNQKRDPLYPATLSENFIQPLLREKGYKGVVISDDLHMGAILQFYSLEEIVIRALKASVDILVFSKNPKAAGDYTSLQENQNLNHIHEIILKALEASLLTEDLIDQAYQRIMRLKNLLKTG